MPNLLHYLASCRGKVRYGHAPTAHNAAIAMEKRGRGEMDYYEWRYCGGWHIGHKRGGAIVIRFAWPNSKTNRR